LQKGDERWTEALSDNYLKVRVPGQHEPNQWLRVKVMEIDDEELVAVGQKAANSIAI